MNNYEKYRSEIEKFTCLGITFGFNKETEKFDTCYNIKCKGCMFFDIGNCIENKMKWAYSEYIDEPSEYIDDEPEETDWLNIPVDTPIMVSSDNMQWHRRHFAKYRDGGVYAWNDGFTSFTSESNNNITWWSYAKLAEVE